MRRKYKVFFFPAKYQRFFPTKKTSILVAILFPALLFAQYEEPDSSDLEAPEEEVYPDSTVEDNSYSRYFIQKSLLEASLDPVHLRHLPDTAIRRLKKNDDFWYADSIFKSKVYRDEKRKEQAQVPPASYPQNGGTNPGMQDKRGSTGSVWKQTVLWMIIIGGFLAFLVVYLANSNVRIFRKRNRSIEDGLAETDHEDIFAINYQKEIDKAASGGNYRLAVRLMFLRLLKNLSEKNIIQYKQDRTNFDYLVQLSASRYYNDFFRITRNYEYAWYGKFEVTGNTYQLIKKDFEDFYPTLKH